MGLFELFRVYILSTQTLVWNWFYFAWYWHDTGGAKFCYFFYQWPFTVSDWIKRTHPMESDQCRDLATNRWSLKNIYISITNILTSYARLDKSSDHSSGLRINQILIETNLLDTSIIRVQLIHKSPKLFRAKTKYRIQLKEIFGQRPKDFMAYVPSNLNILINVHQN